MPFPFVPGGLILALVVLGMAMLLFGMALRALDWTVDAVRWTALAGIVTGLHDWQSTPRPDQTKRGSSGVLELRIEESATTLEELHHVASDVTRHRQKR